MKYKSQKFSILVCIFFILSSHCISQQVNLVPYRKNNKWGYSDFNKNIVIPCKYDHTFMFRGDYARVIYKNKYGLIDKNGKEIIPTKYKSIGQLSTVLYSISGKKYATIVNVQNSKKIENITMIKRLKSQCKNILIYVNDSIGIIDTLGNIICEPYFKEVGYFSDNHAIATTHSGENYLLSCSGNMILLPSEYKNLGKYGNGLIIYSSRPHLYGAIDTLGNVIIPSIYDFIFPFRQEITVIKKGLKLGIVNNKGEIKIPLEYDGYNYSHEHFFLKKDSLFGYIDTTGKILIPFKYKEIRDYNKGQAIVSNGNKLGVIDTSGNTIIEFEYDRIFLKNNQYYLTKNKLHGISDMSGSVIFQCKYSSLWETSDNYFYVVKDGKAGYVDSLENTILPFYYQTLSGQFNDTYWVQSNKKWILVDSELNQISKNSYDYVTTYQINTIGGKYRLVTDTEEFGLTMTENKKKVYFVRKTKRCSDKKCFFRRHLVTYKFELNGYVGRTGIEYFED